MDVARLDLPDLHVRMLERVVAAVRADERFEALLGTDSAYGGFDEHSDIDFVLVVRAEDHAAAMAGRQAFAAGLGRCWRLSAASMSANRAC